jgi:hypothetical protein
MSANRVVRQASSSWRTGVSGGKERKCLTQGRRFTEPFSDSAPSRPPARRRPPPGRRVIGDLQRLKIIFATPPEIRRPSLDPVHLLVEFVEGAPEVGRRVALPERAFRVLERHHAPGLAVFDHEHPAPPDQDFLTADARRWIRPMSRSCRGDFLVVMLGAAAEVEDDLRAVGPIKQRQAEFGFVQFADDALPAFRIGARVYVDLLQSLKVGGRAV